MTTIDRLGLSGIRSYGTEEETFIKFYKPLTIILGRNGSGKSTIIEAVKMATTGDLPPMADNGAAFIHDPRIHNDTETKAKIRLMFTNVRGDQYVVSRHFQLTLKKGPRGIGYKTEFKTLNQAIKKTDDGSAAAFRCTDLNALLPEIMRVTKPVLNNVIFVHQEDSLWPLGDSKKLKEKFDEIFAATRYTRALDTIRKYKKDQDAELKTVNVELMHYEDKVQLLEKVRAEVDDIRLRHDQFRQGVDSLDNEIADLESRKDAAERIAAEHATKCSELEKLKIEASVIEKEKADKYAEMQLHLPDMDEDALATEIKELETFLERASGERSKRAKLIQDLLADVEMKRAELSTRQNRRGMLEQQAKMQTERQSRLESMKDEFRSADLFTAADTAGADPPALPTRSAGIEAWTEALSYLCTHAKEHARSVGEEQNENLEAAAVSLNEIKMRLRESRSASERKTEDLAEKRRAIMDLRNQLRNLQDSESAISEAESKLRAVERMWQEKSSGSRVSTLEESSIGKRKEVSSKREDLAVLRRVRNDLVQNQSEQTKYEMSKEAEVRKKRRAEALVEDFSELLASSVSEFDEDDAAALSRLTDGLVTANALSVGNAEEIQMQLADAGVKVLARKDVVLQRADRQHSDAQAALKSAGMRRAELKSQFETASKALRISQTEIEDVSSTMSRIPSTSVDIDQVTSVLEDISISSSRGRPQLRRERIDSVQGTIESAEKAVVKKSQQISQLESGLLLAEGDLEKFEEDSKHRCPACGISSSKKVEEMRKNLKRRVEYFKDPKSMQAVKKDLGNLEQTVQALKKVHTVGSTTYSVVETFENAKQAVEDAERDVRSCQAEASKALASLERYHDRFGNGTAVDQVAAKNIELKQIFSDWERTRKEVLSMQSSLTATTNETRSLSEIEQETRSVEDELQKLQEDIEKDARALEREREDLRRAENRVNLAKQKCLELQTMAEKHKRLTKEKQDLSAAVRNLETELEELRDTVKKLRVDQEDAEAEYATVREEGKASVRHANEVLSKCKMALHSWEACLEDFNAYNRSGKERELQNVLKSIEIIQADIESRTKDLRAHEKEQQTASDSQKDMESRIRNLKDNQRYRFQEQKLQVNARSARHVQDEIAAVEARAKGDPNEKLSEIVYQINKNKSAREATMGKRQIYTDMYKEKKKALLEAEKQGSRRKFDECRIRKQTMQLASGDLEKYHRALDQALMAFHTLKMNSINRTIKELWQQTYRGTDIDEIEIISDHGDPRAAATGALKRTFKYRVQMRQGQANLDMRGRCSAGQKVLACLVIRLALAESFCTDCGILALDEPTTNLDRENIISLAAALKTIIESRRKQRNFQLVLITHDQEFIDMIGARDFCNDYFMICKDPQGISRARIQALQEM